jgi:transcriptional regulator with XRE-family HTH domain
MTRLKFERQNRQLSQAALAFASHIAQPLISCIEIGRLKPTAAQLARLAAFFRVAPEELLKDVAVLGPRVAEGSK